MRPYRPRASAKIRIKIIPTNILDSIAFALTPESPTMPIASPAAYVIFHKLRNLPKMRIHSRYLMQNAYILDT